jgi:MFS family permease
MRIFHPLRAPPVALLWGGLSLSAIGDQLYAVALTWIAVGVFGANAGYLSALQAACLLVAALGVGKWADRRDQRRAMIGADLARAAILLAVVAYWLTTGAASATALIAAVIVLAVGQAVFQPALQTVLPPLVPDATLLPAANGLLDATDRSARLLGPGLVALLAGVIPAVHFLTLDAATFLASAAALLAIGRLRPNQALALMTTRESVWLGVLRGGQAMRRHRLLGYVLATSGLVNGAWYTALYLGLPLMIERHGAQVPGATRPIGTGLSAFGLVISAYGCTNLAATLFFGSRTLPARPQFQMFSGTLIVGAGIVLLAFASLLPQPWSVPGFAAAAAFSAIGGPMKDIPLAVLRQSRIPAHDRPAAMRAYMVVNSLGLLAAMLMAPSLFARAGLLPVSAACGCVLITIGAIGLVRDAGWVEAPDYAREASTRSDRPVSVHVSPAAHTSRGGGSVSWVSTSDIQPRPPA